MPGVSFGIATARSAVFTGLAAPSVPEGYKESSSAAPAGAGQQTIADPFRDGTLLKP